VLLPTLRFCGSDSWHFPDGTYGWCSRGICPVVIVTCLMGRQLKDPHSPLLVYVTNS
jgi:hypothetical protein